MWDYTFAGNASVLETYISYLRHKIDDDRPAADPHGARRRLQPAPAARLAKRRDDQGGPQTALS